MAGTIGMKQKIGLLILAAVVLVVWFLVYTEDGKALGNGFVYFLKTLTQF